MLLRTVPLLLCVAMAMCATIGHYQTQATDEEEAPAVVADSIAAAVSGDAAEEDVASLDAQKGNSPAAEVPATNSFFGDNLLAKIAALGNPEADKPEVDVPVADSDRPAGDALVSEAVNQEEENDINPVRTNQSLNASSVQEDNNSWSINSIRNSFQTMHGYFDSLVELAGGYKGVCQYRCRYGEAPKARPGYQIPEPNGCSSSLMGLQLDMGIPAMTQCCNKLDVCYDTCGTDKTDCDSEFRLCLHDICSDIEKSLGFASKVQACESMADALHGTVGTLGCRPYMNSQRAACVCEEEERDEL